MTEDHNTKSPDNGQETQAALAPEQTAQESLNSDAQEMSVDEMVQTALEGKGRMPEVVQSLLEQVLNIMPVVLFLLLFNLFFLKSKISNPKDIAIGVVFSIIGLAIFIRGLDMGLLALSSQVGENLTKTANVWAIVVFSFILGYGVTLAEPALQTLGMQVNELSSGIITKNMVVHTVAFGVGLGLVLGMLKIVFSWSIVSVMVPTYALIIIFSIIAPKTLTAVAFDCGGVTTGPVTVPVTLALGVGMATVLGGRDPLIDGFGLIGLSSGGPILTMLILGMIYRF